jgi:hypothetical protein
MLLRGSDPGASISCYLVDRIEGHTNIEVLTRAQVSGVEAWCVNEIARAALGGDRAGDNGLSISRDFDVLRAHHIQRSIEHVDSGMIIVSPTIGNVVGHIGIVGKPLADELSNFIIYSNSSATATFQQNFTLKSWKYKEEGWQLTFLR